MVAGVGEVFDVVADEIPRLVEVDGQRILSGMVNGSEDADNGILAGLERECLPVALYLPYGLDDRDEIREYRSPVIVSGYPNVRPCGIVRVGYTYSQAVQILHL